MPAQPVTERSRTRPVASVCTPGFVGRDRELAAVTDALAAGPAVVLVEGEAGIGKSRLVREYLAAPAAREGRVLTAGCPPYAQPFTLGPVVDAARQATDSIRGLHLSALAGALRPLFPEWAADLPPAPAALTDASAARHRLFRALAELLAGLDVWLLVVEDVHWADEATLEFLLFLVSRPPQRVSLLVSYRPEDVPEGSLLRRLTSRPPGGVPGVRVMLAPLDVAGTASLVSSMLDGQHVSGRFAAFLHERTDGVPLAVEESVRLLCDSGQLVRHAIQWERRGLAELAVPPTVRDAVLDRAQRLGSSARAVLRAAAVLAEPASEPVVIAVTGLAARLGRAGVATALGCGLLGEDAADLVGFRHVLASMAVCEAIPVAERRRLHLRAARVLEGLAPVPVARLARHFREAGHTGEWCRYAEQTADLALATGDDNTAASVLYDVVVHGDVPAAVVVGLARKIPLYALPGFNCLGDLAGCLRRVLDDDSLTTVQQAEGRSLLGRVLLGAREYAAGVAELERAIPGLGHRPVEAARAMALLGWPRRTLWPARVHRLWLDRAAAAVEGRQIPARERMELTVNRATALLDLGEESGWAVAATIPQKADSPDEAEHILRAHLNFSDDAIEWGRYDEARRRLAAGLDQALQHDYPFMRDFLLASQSYLDWVTGRWTGLAKRVLVLADAPATDLQIRRNGLLVTGLLQAAAGDHAAEDTLWQVLDEAGRNGEVRDPLEPAAALARLRLAAGRVVEALELTAEPMRVITVKGIWLWAADIAQARVQALAAAGQCEEAVELVAAFAEGVRGRDAPRPRAALVTCQALLAEGRGRAADAAGLFDQAATAWQALPRPYDALLAREGRARCLLAAGQTEAGLVALRDVFQQLSDLGARGDAVRVMHTLGEHGVQVRRPWWGGRRGYGDQLSPREVEVVRLVVAGHPNREIAQLLCRAPNTVRVQLQSAMRKLGVSSRAALAVHVVEAGIAPESLAEPDMGSSSGGSGSLN